MGREWPEAGAATTAQDDGPYAATCHLLSPRNRDFATRASHFDEYGSLPSITTLASSLLSFFQVRSMACGWMRSARGAHSGQVFFGSLLIAEALEDGSAGLEWSCAVYIRRFVDCRRASRYATDFGEGKFCLGGARFAATALE